MEDRALERAGEYAEEQPMEFSAIIHALRGERDKIDPKRFRYQQEDVIDGDLAAWIGAVHARSLRSRGNRFGSRRRSLRAAAEKVVPRRSLGR